MQRYRESMRTFISGGLLALFAAVPMRASADHLGDYQPMVNLPGVSASIGSLPAFLNALFSIFLGVAIILSVVMLVVAGIELIGAGANESVRSDAKGRIWNAVIGLLIALATWLILSEINPDILDLRVGE